MSGFKMESPQLQVGVDIEFAKSKGVEPELLLMETLRFEFGARTYYDEENGIIRYQLPNIEPIFYSRVYGDETTIFIVMGSATLLTSHRTPSIPQ